MKPAPFEQEPKIRAWKDSLVRHGCTLEELEPLSLLYKRNGELLFALCKADARTPQGEQILPYVLLRGHACIVVPQVTNRETGEERFVMVEQYRIGAAGPSLEFPAGMLDRHTDARLIACRELFEETTLQASPEELCALTDKPLFTSSGLQDEAIYFFGLRRQVEAAEFRRLEGLATGSHDEGEQILVRLKSFPEVLSQSSSAQVRLGLFLFKEICGIGNNG